MAVMFVKDFLKSRSLIALAFLLSAMVPALSESESCEYESEIPQKEMAERECLITILARRDESRNSNLVVFHSASAKKITPSSCFLHTFGPGRHESLFRLNGVGTPLIT